MADIIATSSDQAAPDLAARRISIGFINWAHAIDHYVILIFPTVVIGLEAVYGRSYAELIALGTASFVAFGIFSLPAGWLADRWSRRNMMALFYFGCGVSLLGAALAPNLITLAIALAALGMFAAIYHPVGTAMLIEQATTRGRSLAFNGVCGNLGVAFAAGITAVLASVIGWRGAFVVPAAVCILTGIAYLRLVADDRHKSATREQTPDVRLAAWVAATVFCLFVVIALTAGLVFHIVTVALPKIVDERLGDVSLVLVGGLATVILAFGALAQLAMGRLVEKFPLHILFAVVAVWQLAGVIWAAYATGLTILFALAAAVIGIYAQVTVNDMVIARYTADAWRGRVFAVRYFLTFLVSGAAVSLIALLHGRGGFDLVLAVTAVIALGFVIATAAIAVLVNGVEKERASIPQPAE
ncbi:MAG: MFS transporter [Rhizobiales bacterium]|nr:MFS transporter [Hyphomicrobiales bacterium]